LASLIPWLVNPLATVLKDSLILGAADSQSGSGIQFQLSFNSGIIQFTNYASGVMAYSTGCLIDDPGTSYMIGINQTPIISRIPVGNPTVSVLARTITEGPAGAIIRVANLISSSDAIFLVPQSGSFPILARSNFATIKNPTWVVHLQTSGTGRQLERAHVMIYVNSPNYRLRHFDRLTWN
jgi:hypothetical protein